MKQFTMEEIKGAKEEAKRFNIKVVGRKNAEVLDEVNAALKAEFEVAEAARLEEEKKNQESSNPAPEVGQAEPGQIVVKSLNDYGFEEGEIAYITGRLVNGQKVILANRKIKLAKVSKKPGMFNGQLINDKTGLIQKCEIAIPIEVVIKLQIEAPAPVEENVEQQLQEAQ